MQKRRTAPPKSIKDKVLKEWKHKCAICGADDPQVHHIDENPENNDPQNLLPLCPNCHLKDHHNPTGGIDIGRLRLFRKHKDPTILSPQFLPIYKRFKYLYETDINKQIEKLEDKTNELIGFIRAFNMGDFYAHQLDKTLRSPMKKLIEKMRRTENVLYGDKDKMTIEIIELLKSKTEHVEDLIMELLRYQNWSHK